jgi:hypothetical protein
MRHQPKAISQSQPFPRTAEAFLEFLDKQFPEPRPRASDDLADIMFKAGQRSVVHIVRDAFNKSHPE